MKQSRKRSVLRTFAALILGIVCGLVLFSLPAGFIRDEVLVSGVLYFLGAGFLRLMQMLVIPLVFFSLVCGAAAIGDTHTLGRVGVKTITIYLITTAAAVCLGLSLGSLFFPGAIESVAGQSFAGGIENAAYTLLNVIPVNPAAAFAEGNMLAVILMALLVGITLAHLAERTEIVYNFCRQGEEIMIELTRLVMRLTPLGVFCLMARTFAQRGFDALFPLVQYTAAVLAALFIQCFVVYGLLLGGLTRLNPLTFFQKFKPVMRAAFTTSSSNATLALSTDTLREMGVSRRISSFTIPLGTSIHVDGTTIMQAVAVVFIAEAYHLPLTPLAYLLVILTATLASIGTTGVPSLGLITLSMVLSTVGLPIEGIGLIIGVDRLLDMVRSAVNVTGDAVCTTIVACQEGACNREQFNKK